MSESNPVPSVPRPSGRLPNLQPWTVLAGFVLGLIVCSWVGYRVSRSDYHDNFTRFYPQISPEAHYYPTVSEMTSIVRARCRPDQILVIVGGNSILYGVGQPDAKIWTHELQRLLGDPFCVVNFAFRGAVASDGGAVIAEVLRNEFPRQVYVANAAPIETMDPLGSPPYRFLFWEAYFKGLLSPFQPRDDRLALYFQTGASFSDYVLLKAKAKADLLLHYRDAWNWIGYEEFYSVPSPYTTSLKSLFQPRGRIAHSEPDFNEQPFSNRFRRELHAGEMAAIRGLKTRYVTDTDGTGWTLAPVPRSEFIYFASVAMPPAQKARTLIVLSGSSPFYLEKLTAEERALEEQAFQDSLELWRSLGYNAMTYGSGFTANDFGDRVHLTVEGGRKLASVVAPEVRALASALGYLDSPSSKE